MEWKDHITADPAILVGKPIIKGTRISVERIIDLYSKGWTEEVILENFPHLTSDDLRAVFLYLNDCIESHLINLPTTSLAA